MRSKNTICLSTLTVWRCAAVSISPCTVRQCLPLHECAHTHSWPSRSCVRASSGCRSGAHPGRTVSPALWTQLSALPSVCRTASHTCIAPLQRRRTGAKKNKTLGSVEHFIKMEGTGAWLYSYQEEARWSVTQLTQQLMWVWVQKCNRDGTVWTHRVAVLSDANICPEHPREHKNEERAYSGGRTDRWLYVKHHKRINNEIKLMCVCPHQHHRQWRVYPRKIGPSTAFNLAAALDQNTTA